MTTGLLTLRFALVLAGLAVGSAQAQGTYRCESKGRIIFQQTPCKDETPTTPAPPPPKPPCVLTAEQIRRASHPEKQFQTRFPTEAAHRKVEAAEVQLVTDRIQIARTRRNELVEQRKPLDKELPFYKDKPVPAWLKNKIDANDAHLAAVDDILKSREQELVDVKARFQCQRDTFGKMWAGAAPGSSACDRPACAPP
jgi:hypothetical protein